MSQLPPVGDGDGELLRWLQGQEHKKTDCDCEQVKEEVTKAMDSVFWHMNVEHVGSWCLGLVLFSVA